MSDLRLVDYLDGQDLVRAERTRLGNDLSSIPGAVVREAKRKRVPKIPPLPKHVIIPDTQIRPDVPTAQLAWIGSFIVDELAGEDVTIIHLGDHWDMQSLSSYDQGKRVAEGRRITKDIEAGNYGFDLLNSPLAIYNKGRRNKWEPRKVFLIGNHEDRISRAVNETAALDGLLSLDLLNAAEWGWEVHPFLEVVEIDGVAYSHYFYNQLSGRAYGGQNVDTRLKTIGRTFTQGHQQVLMYGVRTLPTGTMHHGLVAGACYLHEEEYRGPQANAEWRGIIVKHQVQDGSYDPQFVSLSYLCRRYEGMHLSEWMKREG